MTLPGGPTGMARHRQARGPQPWAGAGPLARRQGAAPAFRGALRCGRCRRRRRAAPGSRGQAARGPGPQRASAGSPCPSDPAADCDGRGAGRAPGQPRAARAGGGSWLPAVGSSHLQQPRQPLHLVASPLAPRRCPRIPEDDLLSDSESRSRGNVQLEAGEDVGQVRAAGRGRSGDLLGARCRTNSRPKLPPRESPSPSLGSGVGGRRRDGFFTPVLQASRGPGGV